MSSAREDFLEEDPEIPGQKFALLSFLSPEKVLKDKNIFFFNQFLGSFDRNLRVTALEKYLASVVNDVNEKLDAEADKLQAADLSGAATTCRAAKLRVDTLMDGFHTFVKKSEKELSESKLREQYDDFLYTNKAKLEDEFFAKNEFRTTVRGLKVRGVYGSHGEAVARSKKLQRNDPLHNIFVGEVGKWLPWDPEPNDVAEQEYAEDQLNTLMKKYKENEEARETFAREQRKRATAAASASARRDAAPVEAEPTQADAANYAGMFGSDGPADLAIARKAAASSAAEEEKKE
jgi:hypothetical protein